MNPWLIVIAADADFSTSLISRLSSCDRSFLVDTCVHQFTISTAECCVPISEQDISPDHSTAGCQIHGFYNILEPDLRQNVRHVTGISCSAGLCRDSSCFQATDYQPGTIIIRIAPAVYLVITVRIIQGDRFCSCYCIFNFAHFVFLLLLIKFQILITVRSSYFLH